MTHPRSFQLHEGKSGAAITVLLSLRASKNEVKEILKDGTVKIELTALGESKANEALVDFLSEILGVTTKSIEILAGETGKDKLVTIIGLDATLVQQKIVKSIS